MRAVQPHLGRLREVARVLRRVGLLWLLSTPPAFAQLIELGTWEGALEGVGEMVRLDTQTHSAESSRFDTTHLTEQMTLRNIGASVYDPRLLTLSLGGTFGLSQEWISLPDDHASREGTLSGYDVLASVLSEQPFAVNLFATRSQSILSRELAGRSDVRTENRGVTVFARQVSLPSTLTFRQEAQEEASRTSGIETRREDRKHIVTYEGQRGWIDSDLDVRYEFIDDTDATLPDFSYQSHEGSLVHGIDFGPELNRHLDSRLQRFSRTGVTDLTTWTADESLRIEHSDRLQTGYRYVFTDTRIPEGATSTHTGTFDVQHRLYDNVTTGLIADGTIQSLPGGHRDALRSRLDVGYIKRVPGDGRLHAALRGGLEYEADRFDATVSFVPQEPHTVGASFALPIVLRNVFVMASSVVVTKTALGPLPAGCFAPAGPPTPLVLGRDYTLRAVGDITQLVPISCSGSTPGINPGDTIAVDYQYDVARSLTFATAGWHIDLGVDYGWIRPYAAHEQTIQHLLAGRDGQFLDDRRSDTLGTELRWDGPRLRTSVLGEASRLDSGRVSYRQLRSAQTLNLVILPALTLSLSSDQALLDFLNDDHRTVTRAVQATLACTPTGALLIDLHGALRRLHDTLFPTERTAESSLRLRWFIRGLEVSPILSVLSRRRGGTDTTELQALVRMTRRF